MISEQIIFSEIFNFKGKTSRRAGDGYTEGTYPFFTSSETQTKFLNEYDHKGPCIILGTGGSANVHYCERPFATSADCFVASVKVDRTDMAKFYYYFLKSNLKILEAGFRGAGLKHISKRFVESLLLPHFLTDYQMKAVTILDRADGVHHKRQESIRLTEEFLRSVFLNMFGDPVTNPKEWDKAPLKNLGIVTTGNTPSREHPEYYGEGIEWIKSDNINTPYHFLTKAKEFLTPEGQKIGRIVPENSVLVTCIAGSPDCIGNAALTNRPVSFNQQINAITPFEGTDPYFLYVHFLVSKKLVQQESTESMKGMVNKSKFENILFLKPPYPLQHNFGKIFNRIHNVFSRNNNAVSLSEDLFKALTQKAFRGEL